MSLQLEFTPHSYYYEFAIKKDENYNDPCEWRYDAYDKTCIVHGHKEMIGEDYCEGYAPQWSAFIDDGNTYSVIELQALTLKELKSKIRAYWLRDNGKHVPTFYAKTLMKAKEA